MFSTCKRIFYLHQILKNETLQVMEPIPKEILAIQFFFFSCDFSKIKKTLLNNVYPFRWFLWLCFHLKLEVWKWENHLQILGITLTLKWECVWILKHYPSNTTYPKHKINNPNYCVPMVIFQRYKNNLFFEHYPSPLWLLLLHFHALNCLKYYLSFPKKIIKTLH